MSFHNVPHPRGMAAPNPVGYGQHQVPVAPLSRVAEAGRNGVTPELWNEILTQMQHLITDNEKLRSTLEENNNELDKILTTKNREIDEAHKLYSDARISVLGYRAQILKIRGEHLIKDEEEEHKMIGIGQIEQQKFQEVKKDLETRLQQFEVEYSDAMNNLQAQKKENQELHQHYQTQIYNLRGELERVKTTPVPVPRSNQPRESAQMEQLQKENRTLQNQLERAKQTQRQYEAIRNEYEELKEKHEYINEEVSNHKQQIRDMHYEVQSKMRELSNKDREIISLKSQVEQLQQQPPLPSMAIGGADDRGGGGGNARMRRQLNDEIGKKNEAIRERDMLRNELEQYRSKDLGQLEEMQQQLYQSAQDYQSLKSQQDKLRSEKAQLKSEKAQLEEQLQEKDKELLDVNTLKEANEQLQVDIQNSKEAIHSLEVELSRKQSQIEQLKKDSDEDKSWEGVLDEMEKELTRIQHESTQLKQLNRQYEKDIEEWKTAKANVDAKLDKKLKDCKEYIDQATLWKEQFESARNEFNMERVVREKEAQAISALRQDRDSLQKEVHALRGRVTEQQQVIASVDPSLLSTIGEPIPHYSQQSSPSNTRPHGMEQKSNSKEHPNVSQRHSDDQQKHNDQQRYNQPPNAQGGYVNVPPQQQQHQQHRYNNIPQPNPPQQQRYNQPIDQQQRYNQPIDQQQRYNQPNVQQRYNQPNAQQLGGYNVPSPNQRRAQTGVQPTVGATNDLNIPSRPVDRVSGGGQLGGSHFQSGGPQVTQTRTENISGTTPFKYNEFPPIQQDKWQPVNSRFNLPGEVTNNDKPVVDNCPICGMGGFPTQTALELHCAKCC